MLRALLLVASILAASTCAASQINPISLAELQTRADFVVMAKVTKVEAMGDADTVSIRVSSYLKGKHDAAEFTFTLVTRGGIKDFDPAVKVGDTGVFFLKALDEKGAVGKAYWGSIALFPKNHFGEPDKK
jgi:hypothetical protein